MKFRFAAASVVLSLTLLTSLSFAQGNSSQSPTLPADSRPHGKTYTEWSVAWWQWFFSIPAATNPSSGGPCDARQSGHVWFLASLFSPSPVAVACNVPSGTMLFFPLINVDCSKPEPPPYHGDTPEERQACATGMVSGIEADLQLTLTVDGKSLENPKSYRVASPDFTFRAPQARRVRHS